MWFLPGWLYSSPCRGVYCRSPQTRWTLLQSTGNLLCYSPLMLCKFGVKCIFNEQHCQLRQVFKVKIHMKLRSILRKKCHNERKCKHFFTEWHTGPGLWALFGVVFFFFSPGKAKSKERIHVFRYLFAHLRRNFVGKDIGIEIYSIRV